MEDDGLSLPEELLSCGSGMGNEFRCRKKDLLTVAAAAERDGIASDGWKVQFRTSDGECELCWESFYPEEKRENETWHDYVSRSWEESRQMWQRLFDNANLIKEGIKTFRLIQVTEDVEILPRDALWFVLYLRSSTQNKQGHSDDIPPETSD